MALGLLAGISSIIKNLIIADFGKPGLDMWAMNVSISTWTALEMLLGIIAACVPFCRPVLERCLSSVGLSISKSKPTAISGGGATPGYAAGVGVSSGGYQRANERDAFRSGHGGMGMMTTSSKNMDRSESDEEDLAGVAIEMQPGVGGQGQGIRKHTDIHVHSSVVDDTGHPGQSKYYLAV